MGAIRSRIGVVSVMVVVAAAAVMSDAQDSDLRSVDNPYQEGFAYTIGSDLTPNVDITGLRWTLVKIAPRNDREIEADKETPIEVTLEFENRAPDSAKAQVIILLEAADGSPLERITCDPVKVGDGRFKQDTQKHKLQGSTLLNATRAYLYCEVEF